MTVKTYIGLWITLGLLGLAPIYWELWKIVRLLETVVSILHASQK
jgi:hypothetical protein